MTYDVMANYAYEMTNDLWDEINPAFFDAPTTAPNVTMTAGTRAGYVELRFAVKPDSAIRNELKGQSFRWSPRNGCWYGLSSRLPSRYLAN